MTQERMHPEDIRREMAMRVWDSCSAGIEAGQAVRWAVEIADAILAELARTAKPEVEPRDPRPGEIDNAMLVNHLDAMKDRAEMAESRVKKLENAIRSHRDLSPSLGQASFQDTALWNLVK